MKSFLFILALASCLLKPEQVEARVSCREIVKDFVSPKHFVERRFGENTQPGFIGQIIYRLTPSHVHPRLTSFRSSSAFLWWLYIDWTLAKLAAAALGIYAGATVYQMRNLEDGIKRGEEGNAYLENWNQSVSESLDRLRGQGT